MGGTVRAMSPHPTPPPAPQILPAVEGKEELSQPWTESEAWAAWQGGADSVPFRTPSFPLLEQTSSPAGPTAGFTAGQSQAKRTVSSQESCRQSENLPPSSGVTAPTNAAGGQKIPGQTPKGAEDHQRNPLGDYGAHQGAQHSNAMRSTILPMIMLDF